jgi:adenylate cyclase
MRNNTSANKKTLLGCILASLFIAFIASVFFSVGFYSHFQAKLGDFLYGGEQPLDNVVIIGIDDESLQKLGRWPWERGNFTKLLNFLDQSEVVGFDIGFFEPSSLSSDSEFAAAVEKAGNVVLPIEFTEFKSEKNQMRGTKFLRPIPQLKDAAASLGYINVMTDADGITRAVNFGISGDYEPFAYAVLREYVPKSVEKQERFLINYVGRPGSYRTYSFYDVLNRRYDKSEFKNKLVLVGATAPDLHDNYFVPTSYGVAMPGVEINANIVQQLLTGKTLRPASDYLTIFLIFLAAVGVALAVFYFSEVFSVALCVGAVLVYFFISIFAFDTGLILNLVYIPVTIVLVYTSVMIFLYVSERKSRKKILGAFEKYVSKNVIAHMLEHPELLSLGGEKRTITIFFSDIRGFTSISERLSPEQLVRLLNEYLAEMTDIIFRHDGVVDKYMGDAIMAFWNAPLNQRDHAELACLASLEMEKRLFELQKKWRSSGVPEIDIGIGINTGPAVVGNMGSYERFDYTAMGDTVNIGSRLEALNKHYGTRIIISENTINALKRKNLRSKKFLVRMLDRVVVKGKKEPVLLYELVAKEPAPEYLHKMVEHFEKGLDFYFSQKWDKAVSEFKISSKIKEQQTGRSDSPSVLFIERCDYFKKSSSSPGKRWNGVWVMKDK